MVKLIVQIPCFNEEATLPQTIADIPRKIPGIDSVEVLVIDDGSTDRTGEVALECGADYLIRNRNNKGLARTFRVGLDAALAAGADIIVNTDGDNQYAGWDIPLLVKPILDGQADFVIGDRQTGSVSEFSTSKKILQNVGSRAVRALSGVDVPDAVSGFRAFSREVAMNMNVVSSFSYTIETLIQVGKKHYAVASVPISTNPKTRSSRLFKSIPQFIGRSGSTMLRIYAMYQPMRIFFAFGLLAILIGSLPVFRFLYYYFSGSGEGMIQSLVIGGVLVLIGGLSLMFGLIADIINFNRQLIEMTLERVRRLDMKLTLQDVSDDQPATNVMKKTNSEDAYPPGK